MKYDSFMMQILNHYFFSQIMIKM